MTLLRVVERKRKEKKERKMEKEKFAKCFALSCCHRQTTVSLSWQWQQRSLLCEDTAALCREIADKDDRVILVIRASRTLGDADTLSCIRNRITRARFRETAPREHL